MDVYVTVLQLLTNASDFQHFVKIKTTVAPIYLFNQSKNFMLIKLTQQDAFFDD
jgi:hypothetical protein